MRVFLCVCRLGKKIRRLAEILVFQMCIAKRLQGRRALLPNRVVTSSKVCRENYLDDESLLNKICGLKKPSKKTFCFCRKAENFGFSNVVAKRVTWPITP